jgi:hypothetical protein
MIGRRPLMELEFWHAFDRVKRGDASLEFALAHWTQLWNRIPWSRSSDPEDTPLAKRRLYAEILTTLSRLYEQHQSDTTPKGFSETAADCLESLVKEYEQGFQAHPPNDIRWSGCFGFTVSHGKGSNAALHFYNARWPHSPFRDVSRLMNDLQQCLETLRSQYPRVKGVSCGSWINNLPSFLALFPERYRISLHPTSPDGKNGMGWWGQFIRHDGLLNGTRAEQLRQRGDFPYVRKFGFCPLAELVASGGVSDQAIRAPSD